MLPVDYGPSTDPFAGPGEPIIETVWIEPYPDTELEDGLAGPEARYEQRESIELAFIAALQHLPASPARGADPARGARLLRQGGRGGAGDDASPRSTARCSAPARRSRSACPTRASRRRCARSTTTSSSEIVKTYVDAWERNDVEAVVALLTEDAAIAMPPLASWFGPRDEFATFLAATSRCPAQIAWKMRITTANGQPAFGAYAWDEDEQAYMAFALNVLTFRGDKICDVVAFAIKEIDADAQERYHRWDTEGTDATRLRNTFERFGLPDRLLEPRRPLEIELALVRAAAERSASSSSSRSTRRRSRTAR